MQERSHGAASGTTNHTGLGAGLALGGSKSPELGVVCVELDVTVQSAGKGQRTGLSCTSGMVEKVHWAWRLMF